MDNDDAPAVEHGKMHGLATLAGKRVDERAGLPMLNFQQAGVDGVIAWTDDQPGGLLAKQRKTLDMNFGLAGSTTFSQPPFRALAGDAANGVYAITQCIADVRPGDAGRSADRPCKQVYRVIVTAVLLVEQNARLALAVAHRAYVLSSGRVAAEGPAQALTSDERVKNAYLGIAA